MATQDAIILGRRQRGWTSHLIGASMRSADQIFDLAGLDVFTMPTAAAQEYRAQYDAQPRAVESQVGRDFPVETSVPEIVDRLWTVDESIYRLGDKLAGHDVEGWSGADFAGFAREHGVPDLFHEWSAEDIRQIRADGKIPKWERWRGLLESGRAGLDDLMTQAALNSFVTDQRALDDRLRKLLGEAGLA
jgi:transaldolase